MAKKFACRVMDSGARNDPDFPSFAKVSQTSNGSQWYSWELSEDELILLYDTIGQFLTHAGERNYEGKDEKVSVLVLDQPF